MDKTFKQYMSEMSLHRKQAFLKAHGQAENIKKHILYLMYYYNDSNNVHVHWKKEIVTAFDIIERITLKPNDKPMKYSDLFEILFEGCFDPINEKAWIESIEYQEEKPVDRKININDKVKKIEQMYKKICAELSQGSYKKICAELSQGSYNKTFLLRSLDKLRE